MKNTSSSGVRKAFPAVTRPWRRGALRAALILSPLACAATEHDPPDPAAGDPARPQGGHARINGLDMYYEIQGQGRPLVLLHGAVANTEASFGGIRPALARSWKTIGVEQQGHGGTADIDRPLSYGQMADDTAALLRHLGITTADFFGWSDGGRIGLQIAIRYPELVHKLAVIGSSYTRQGEYDWVLQNLETSKAEDWPAAVREIYTATAVDPARFPVMVAKLTRLWLDFEGWQPEDLRAIGAPTLVAIGDGDSVRPEHALEMFRLLPHAQLAVLPLSDHLAPVQRAGWLVPMLEAFFNAP